MEMDRSLVEWLHMRAVDEQPRPGQDGAGEDIDGLMRRVVARDAGGLSSAQREKLVELLVAEAAGVGSVERLFADPEVTEVMVNGPDEVWVERRGRLERAAAAFASEIALREAADRMLEAAGRRVDDLHPIADARMTDGSRLNVVLPPLSGAGPVLTIRRFPASGRRLADLVAGGTLTGQEADELRSSVARGSNILICGATGSGKSTTLAALAAEIPAGQRIITVEDTAELAISHPHVVALEARPASSSGRGAVSIRDLVRNALRMRPDRLIVGEVRGSEAADMVEALSTGHRGSLSTIHADSADGALERLERLVLSGSPGESVAEVRARVRAAIDVVVVQERTAIGERRVVEVSGGTAGGGVG